MRRTFGDYVFRSFMYIAVMNLILYILCAMIDVDFELTLIGNAVVPVICAFASFYGEDLRAKRLALKKGQR